MPSEWEVTAAAAADGGLVRSSSPASPMLRDLCSTKKRGQSRRETTHRGQMASSVLVAAAASSVGTASSRAHVFVYGSLMASEVVETILGRVPPTHDATLHNFRRYSIRGRVYPAILPLSRRPPSLVEEGEEDQRFSNAPTHVPGKLITDLSPLELEIFDSFEDDEYVRESVTVRLAAAAKQQEEEGREVQTMAYIAANKILPKLYGSWDYERWRREELTEYLKMCRSFIQDFHQQQQQGRAGGGGGKDADGHAAAAAAGSNAAQH
ncbi:putative gamma-glutamylcyclotransferase [Balamuthia mandrillaris]